MTTKAEISSPNTNSHGAFRLIFFSFSTSLSQRLDSLSLVFAGLRQRNEPSSRKDLLEFVQKRVVHQSVRRQCLTAVQFKRRSVEAADLAARFFHDEHAPSGIPGIEIKFPEAIEAAAGDIAQIERRRSRAPDAVRAQRDLVIEINIGILVALMAGKTGRDQAFLQLRGLRHVDRLAIEVCASSLLSRE